MLVPTTKTFKQTLTTWGWDTLASRANSTSRFFICFVLAFDRSLFPLTVEDFGRVYACRSGPIPRRFNPVRGMIRCRCLLRKISLIPFFRPTSHQRISRLRKRRSFSNDIAIRFVALTMMFKAQVGLLIVPCASVPFSSIHFILCYSWMLLFLQPTTDWRSGNSGWVARCSS